MHIHSKILYYQSTYRDVYVCTYICNLGTIPGLAQYMWMYVHSLSWVVGHSFTDCLRVLFTNSSHSWVYYGLPLHIPQDRMCQRHIQGLFSVHWHARNSCMITKLCSVALKLQWLSESSAQNFILRMSMASLDYHQVRSRVCEWRHCHILDWPSPVTCSHEHWQWIQRQVKLRNLTMCNSCSSYM